MIQKPQPSERDLRAARKMVEWRNLPRSQANSAKTMSEIRAECGCLPKAQADEDRDEMIPIPCWAWMIVYVAVVYIVVGALGGSLK